MAWLKLEDTFCDHPKFYKLGRMLGCGTVTAQGHIARLWAWVLRHAPDGNLESFDEHDIAHAAGWEGETSYLTDALLECRLITIQQGVINVNGWLERAGSYAEAVKKNRQRQKAKTAQINQETQTRRGVPGQSPDSPPTVPGMSRARREEKRRDNTMSNKADQSEVAEIWGVHQALLDQRIRSKGKTPRTRKLGEKDRKAIRNALKLTDAEGCKAAIQGMFKTPHNLGENDRKTEYLGIHIALKPENLDRFMSAADSPVKHKAASAVLFLGKHGKPVYAHTPNSQLSDAEQKRKLEMLNV